MRKKNDDKSKAVNEIPIQSASDPAGGLMLFGVFVKATILALVLVIVPLGTIFGFLSYRYVHTLLQHAKMDLPELVSTLRSGWQTEVIQDKGRQNILILGVDSADFRDTDNINTDTMMIASLGLDSGVMTTFSIPRDLYLVDRKQKINAVYGYALKSGDPQPFVTVKAVVEPLLGLKIHKVVLVGMDQVGALIDALGGVEVTVAKSFTDERYPRSGVDVSIQKDPKILYKTVSFQAGKNHFDGERALEFMRSRHSLDPQEGSDDARALRQQLVIQAIIMRLKDRHIFKNPAYIGDLIALYRNNFQTYIALDEVVALGKMFLQKGGMPEFTSKHFPIQGVEKNPLLYHPARFPGNQWVYLLVDPSGKQLQAKVKEWLP